MHHTKINRLATALVKTYTNLSMHTAIKDITLYRISRDRNEPDWEGARAQFQRILRAAIKRRHKK